MDEILEDIKECACDEETTVQSSVLGSGRGGKFTLPAKTVRVRVVITSLGSNVRLQGAEGTAPDVHFVGWYAFGSASMMGDRTSISFIENSFDCPEDSTHFAFSLNYQSVGIATAFYKEPV